MDEGPHEVKKTVYEYLLWGFAPTYSKTNFFLVSNTGGSTQIYQVKRVQK